MPASAVPQNPLPAGEGHCALSPKSPITPTYRFHQFFIFNAMKKKNKIPPGQGHLFEREPLAAPMPPHRDDVHPFAVPTDFGIPVTTDDLNFIKQFAPLAQSKN